MFPIVVMIRLDSLCFITKSDKQYIKSPFALSEIVFVIILRIVLSKRQPFYYIFPSL